MKTKKRLVMFGHPITCKHCSHTYALFGERSNTDQEVVKNLAHYDLWKLGVRLHALNCANKRFENSLHYELD